jgi:hypothetical protein
MPSRLQREDSDVCSPTCATTFRATLPYGLSSVAGHGKSEQDPRTVATERRAQILTAKGFIAFDIAFSSIDLGFPADKIGL